MVNESYFATHTKPVFPQKNWQARHSNPADPKDKDRIWYRMDYGL